MPAAGDAELVSPEVDAEGPVLEVDGAVGASVVPRARRTRLFAIMDRDDGPARRQPESS